ncbi:MAG: peroxiredoxin, partial [Bacteroidota bacterium]
MTLVGKKFPSIEVNAMNELGDTIQIDVLNEAVNN